MVFYVLGNGSLGADVTGFGAAHVIPGVLDMFRPAGREARR